MMLVVVGKSLRNLAAQEELKWESLMVEDLIMLATTQALFGGARTFLFKNAIAGGRGEEFLELAGELVKSPHTFIFEEEKLLKVPTEVLTKAGAKIETKIQEKKEWKFDQFGLAAALATHDKKKLWLGLTLALYAGEKPEALAGLLAWKARQMGDTKLSRELTFMYHDSHRGAGELELLLERFVLKV